MPEKNFDIHLNTEVTSDCWVSIDINPLGFNIFSVILHNQHLPDDSLNID